MPKYYPINEEAAKRAKDMNSFSDYQPGSTTASYRAMVDEAYAAAGVTHEQFWKAVNRAQAGPVRLEADELTYALHILVRYEMEKKLISGELSVHDAPAEWNRMYEEYLGVTPENDARGILQDSHWAGTSIGYFPTYALGSAYGAQMLDKMLQDKPDLWDIVSGGDLTPVTEWLKEHIHKYACYYKPKDLFENACGKFDTKYFIDYLTKKYTEVYGL